MTRLTWADLLIDDISPDAFQGWSAPWAGIVNGPVAPAFVTRFGHWFLRRPEGPVEMLDVFTGQLHRAADDYDTSRREVDQVGWQEVHLLSELVTQLHQAGKVAGPGQRYALSPHPAVGGPNLLNGDAVDVRFVMAMDVPVWQATCSRSVGLTGGRLTAACPA